MRQFDIQGRLRVLVIVDRAGQETRFCLDSCFTQGHATEKGHHRQRRVLELCVLISLTIKGKTRIYKADHLGTGTRI